MNKREFLQQLKKQLKNIKGDDLEDILEDYAEYFEEASKDGKSDKEISEDLGNPKDIAKELRTYSVIEKAEKNFTFENIIQVVATFLSLGIFNLVLIFPYLGALVVLFGIVLISIILMLGGLGSLFLLIVSLITQISLINNMFPTFFYSMGAIGGGLLLGMLDYFAIKYFYKFTIKYIKMNIKFVKERDKI